MHKNVSSPRKFTRLKGVKRAFLVATEIIDALPLHIVDISKGGLSYRYLGKNCFYTTKVNLYHESELIAEDIPVQPVSDKRFPNNMIPLRRGSFRFGELNSEQDAQVERFIAVCTEQPAETA